ncbi:DUF262 domain-containing protein [Rhodococcus gordoniae]
MGEPIEPPISVTKTVYTVTDFLGWHRQGELNLRPYFQRGDVWTPKAKSYLIDTLIRGYPVPIIYLQNKQDRKTLKNVRQVVDGQQRLRTILSYIDPDSINDREPSDQFSILRTHNDEFAGMAFSDLPDSARDQIANTELSVHVLQSAISDQQLLQLFARLNSTGEKLTDQELRNAEFHGSFKTLAYRLSYEQLDRWRDWGVFNPRAIARMRDVELTSEFMAYTLNGLQGRSKAALDATYRKYDDEFPWQAQVESRISSTLAGVDSIYRQIGDESSRLRSVSWLYTLFAAVDTTLHGAPILQDQLALPSGFPSTLSQLRRMAQSANRRLEAGDVPDELSRALRGASTDPGSRSARLNFLLTA